MSKISRKVLISVSIAIAMIIALFVSLNEFRNYGKAVNLLAEQQAKITEGQSIMLSQFMHDNNTDSIYLTLTGIVANPMIVAVDVINASGELIFTLGEISNKQGMLEHTRQITFFKDDQVMELGKLTTYATDAIIFKDLKSRLWSLSLMILIVVVATVTAVAITMRNVVEAPVKMLVDAFQANQSNSDTQPQALVWDKNDEMGFLISEFNDLNARVFQTVSDLKTELIEVEIMEGERFKRLADASSEAVLICSDEKVVDLNDAARSILEVHSEDVIGKYIDRVLLVDQDECFDLLEEADGEAIEQLIFTNTGHKKVVEISKRRLDYGDKKSTVYALRDVTEDIVAQQKIEFLAHYDYLTGLSNRFKFNSGLNQLLADVNHDTNPIAVYCLDLDGFKSINDLNGHAAGDELLVKVAKRLKVMVGPNDLVARLGGDEFAIAMNCGDAQMDPGLFGDKVIDEIAKAYNLSCKTRLEVGVSIGIMMSSSHMDTCSHLLKKADLALYEAKHRGKCQYQFYQRSFEEARYRNTEIERRLRATLNDKNLDIYFQPQANLTTKEIVGYEALVRWLDPVLGSVPPLEFIPIAEQCGLIQEMGQQVLFMACLAAAKWPENIRLAVNLAPSEFADPNLTNTIQSILEQTELSPNRLELEITEKAIIQDEKLAFDLIHELKALGIRIAIDDFGTGYSSLSYLQRYPFDRIKIDKSFIKHMDENIQSAKIVRSIITLAHSLDIDVIAEGVEEKEDLIRLKSERCNEVQGYIIGKPVPNSSLPYHGETQAQTQIEAIAV